MGSFGAIHSKARKTVYTRQVLIQSTTAGKHCSSAQTDKAGMSVLRYNTSHTDYDRKECQRVGLCAAGTAMIAKDLIETRPHEP